MNDQICPVVLVHGWNSHPGVWNRLISRLEDASIQYWNFSHTGMNGAAPDEIAAALQEYICRMREDAGYPGLIDIVCHSMGTCIARYMLEVIDGEPRKERVRQLIGIGPPNNGSSLAELFNDPEYGPEILDQLAGVFIPHGFDPADDVIVQEFRPGSRTIADLEAASVRDDIYYRLLLTANFTGTPDFFPCFNGKTWEFYPDTGWQTTYSGDGIVPHSESFLPGAGLDILPANPAVLEYSPEQYCHIRLPQNPEVITRVMEYLNDPATQPRAFCPESSSDGEE